MEKIEGEKLLKSLIGKTKDEGKELCKNKGYKVRVVREDSNRYMVTMDFWLDRINLSLDNGIITNATIG